MKNLQGLSLPLAYNLIKRRCGLKNHIGAMQLGHIGEIITCLLLKKGGALCVALDYDVYWGLLDAAVEVKISNKDAAVSHHIGRNKGKYDYLMVISLQRGLFEHAALIPAYELTAIDHLTVPDNFDGFLFNRYYYRGDYVESNYKRMSRRKISTYIP